MNDPFSGLISALETAAAGGLMEVDRRLNEMAEPMAPHWTNALSESMFEERRGKSVFAVTGEGAPGGRSDVDVGAYVAYQYERSLRHRGKVGQNLLDLTALHRDALTENGQHKRLLKNGNRVTVNTKHGRRNTGTDAKNLYARAYKLARERGEITLQDPSQWYDRAADLPSFGEEADEIMVRFWDATGS